MEFSQPKGPICQSCTMPLEKPEEFGTNADGSKSKDYCKFCFQKGKFTESSVTLKQMQDKCAGMMKQMGMPAPQVAEIVKFLPKLKRWQGK